MCVLLLLRQDPDPSKKDDDNGDDDEKLALMVALPIVSVVFIALGVLACWYNNRQTYVHSTCILRSSLMIVYNRRLKKEMNSPFLAPSAASSSARPAQEAGGGKSMKKATDDGIEVYVPPSGAYVPPSTNDDSVL